MSLYLPTKMNQMITIKYVKTYILIFFRPDLRERGLSMFESDVKMSDIQRASKKKINYKLQSEVLPDFWFY